MKSNRTKVNKLLAGSAFFNKFEIKIFNVLNDLELQIKLESILNDEYEKDNELPFSSSAFIDLLREIISLLRDRTEV